MFNPPLFLFRGTIPLTESWRDGEEEKKEVGFEPEEAPLGSPTDGMAGGRDAQSAWRPNA